MTFSIKPGLEVRRVGDELIIMDPDTCKFYRLAAEAAESWDLLCRGEGASVEPAVLQEFMGLGLVIGDSVPVESPLPSPLVAQYDAFTVHASHYLPGVKKPECDTMGYQWVGGKCYPPH